MSVSASVWHIYEEAQACQDCIRPSCTQEQGEGRAALPSLPSPSAPDGQLQKSALHLIAAYERQPWKWWTHRTHHGAEHGGWAHHSFLILCRLVRLMAAPATLFLSLHRGLMNRKFGHTGHCKIGQRHGIQHPVTASWTHLFAET